MTSLAKRLSARVLTLSLGAFIALLAAVPAFSATRPVPWCGQPAATDRTANDSAPGRPKVKVVYARPVDVPDRFAEVAPLLQHGAVAGGWMIAEASAWRKTLRFDWGSDCSPDVLDIQSVILPHPLADYRDNLARVLRDLLSLTRENRLRGRVLAVYADRVFKPGGTVAGINLKLAENNIVIVPGQDELPSSDGFYITNVMLHELLHAFGAVDRASPHSTGNSHCIDGLDVMCYDDDGPKASQYAGTTCGARSGPFGAFLPVDCGGDDYFNASPPAGSFLEAKPSANTYHHPMLATCAERPALCDGNVFPLSDFDHDLIPDDADECPEETDKGGGPCPDRDMDAFPDARDRCPDYPGDRDGCQERPNVARGKIRDTDGIPIGRLTLRWDVSRPDVASVDLIGAALRRVGSVAVICSRPYADGVGDGRRTCVRKQLSARMRSGAAMFVAARFDGIYDDETTVTVAIAKPDERGRWRAVATSDALTVRGPASPDFTIP